MLRRENCRLVAVATNAGRLCLLEWKRTEKANARFLNNPSRPRQTMQTKSGDQKVVVVIGFMVVVWFGSSNNRGAFKQIVPKITFGSFFRTPNRPSGPIFALIIFHPFVVCKQPLHGVISLSLLLYSTPGIPERRIMVFYYKSRCGEFLIYMGKVRAVCAVLLD